MQPVGLLVSAWIGAVVFFSTGVAPALFRVAPTRAAAGQLVGEMLPMLFLSGMLVAGGTLVLVTARRETLLRRWRSAAACAGVMLASLFTAHVVIGRRIAAVRALAGGSLETLAADDPVRREFGLLHAYSVLALGIALAVALALVWVTRQRSGVAHA